MLAEANPFPDYVDLVEAAALLRIHPQTARGLIKREDLPSILVFGKYLIQRDALRQFATSYDRRPGRKRLRRLL